MKTLTLSISGGGEKENDEATVSLTARFENKAEAINFHSKVAALCAAYGAKPHGVPGALSWPQRLLTKG